MDEEEKGGVKILEKGLTQKTITIKTIRLPEDRNNYIKLRGIASKINFSYPILDYKGKENKELRLKTFWFYLEGPLWNIWLDNQDGYVFLETKFGQLKEPLRDYSERKLKEWQEQAIERHRKCLEKIEDLYYKGKEIPKNFLNY